MKINYHSNCLSDNIINLHNELKHPNGHYITKQGNCNLYSHINNNI